jgi:hypothetical protein
MEQGPSWETKVYYHVHMSHQLVQSRSKLVYSTLSYRILSRPSVTRVNLRLGRGFPLPVFQLIFYTHIYTNIYRHIRMHANFYVIYKGPTNLSVPASATLYIFPFIASALYPDVFHTNLYLNIFNLFSSPRAKVQYPSPCRRKGK